MKTNILRILGNRLTPLIVGLATAVAVPLGFVAQASAAWSCASGFLCLYTDSNYGGDVLNYSGHFSSGYCDNVGSQFNDRISSVHNYLSQNVQLFVDGNCTGSALVVYAGQSLSSMPGWGWNDVVSSVRFL